MAVLKADLLAESTVRSLVVSKVSLTALTKVDQ
jgi:hypothetical protein